VIIVSALSLRDKERVREREIERELDNYEFDYFEKIYVCLTWTVAVIAKILGTCAFFVIVLRFGLHSVSPMLVI